MNGLIQKLFRSLNKKNSTQKAKFLDTLKRPICFCVKMDERVPVGTYAYITNPKTTKVFILVKMGYTSWICYEDIDQPSTHIDTKKLERILEKRLSDGDTLVDEGRCVRVTRI